MLHADRRTKKRHIVANFVCTL